MVLRGAYELPWVKYFQIGVTLVALLKSKIRCFKGAPLGGFRRPRRKTGVKCDRKRRLRGWVIFFPPRGWVIFFCPERLGDFFCPERFGVFFGPRGWVIFFCPEKLGDFILYREVG